MLACQRIGVSPTSSTSGVLRSVSGWRLIRISLRGSSASAISSLPPSRWWCRLSSFSAYANPTSHLSETYGAAEIGVAEVSMSPQTATEVRTLELHAPEISPAQVSKYEFGVIHNGAAQVGSAKVGAAKVSIVEITFSQLWRLMGGICLP